MSLIVAGTIRVPPANLDAFRPHMLAMMAATRAEDGCMAYSYAEDVAEPGLIRVFEAWRDQDHAHSTDYQWVSLEQISPHAAIAVIASEDQQFPFHAGFDFNSIREAVRASERGKRLRGASTISQQVAKNLFLWPGHSFVRKGLEARLAQ